MVSIVYKVNKQPCHIPSINRSQFSSPRPTADGVEGWKPSRSLIARFDSDLYNVVVGVVTLAHSPPLQMLAFAPIASRLL